MTQNHLKEDFFIFCSVNLIFAVLSGTSVFVKTPKDVILDNSVFVELLMTILPAIESTCLYHCETRTEGRANLRRYNSLSKECKCFVASEADFRDSRDVAPIVQNVTFIINCKNILTQGVYLQNFQGGCICQNIF